ncbi:hypothetical protein HanRHA438_Chr02g0087181 [Helianthus annuus]|uniref:Uncharacterized protein n=1 Tax=Helianthus annuus TaxID=4232 RepID=A0A251SIE7_HELAN|nr:uncharacterized protein LOC110903814 isoform X3 [Helianthus annuus]XP_022005291.1 uncharacterized protein LOC110903814 isoform X3 [Helianthus annuus]XP_022005292.1 uncharacterized protein LOC110903814 isoform X3 [Helianthus annuus]KAF5769598.1 hypothetical protein HanXRQr2_Chr14g0650161 [Helianthus annuus]KAJ0486175.1 hypothetical protein HanHA89_Chr14g0576801 [Helianthus annuus]KAJ0527936.1 hypothetical protein HanHA300_Chr09g0339611 [Helianthus annuus]KAJ0616263.1 hypothetical protein Ha
MHPPASVSVRNGLHLLFQFPLGIPTVAIMGKIISRRQIDETTIDPLELLKNLKGWTVKKYKCTETNGRYRVDKTYRHPKSKKWLRSLCKVREFILDSSYTGKASDNGEGGSQLVKITGFFGLKFGEFGVMSIGDFHNLQFSKLKLPY